MLKNTKNIALSVVSTAMLLLGTLASGDASAISINQTAAVGSTPQAGWPSFDFNGTTSAANSVWYRVSGDDVIVYADNNGDGLADIRITLLDHSDLKASDFLL